MTGTGVKGDAVLPKPRFVPLILWWRNGPRWNSEPPQGTPYTVSVSVSPFGPGRLLVDRVESKIPLPDMNREDWTAICRALKEALSRDTSMKIGAVTPDLFMELKDGLVNHET